MIGKFLAHKKNFYLCLYFGFLGNLLHCSINTFVAYAQVTLDGSLGSQPKLSGPHWRIPAEVGQQHGRNLFHSFDTFNLARGQSATFTGPGTILRILARVTGGEESRLNGTLRSEIAGADLFLINPQGIIFGPNATLDLQGGGSFYATTADVLRFRDGGVFHATLHESSMFSAASPEAFGFLQSQPAAIVTRGSNLRVESGATLALIGGDLQLRNSTLTAPSGQLRVVSVGGMGDITFQNIPFQDAEHLPLGIIRLQEGTLVTNDEEGGGGGTITLLGSRIAVEDSLISSNTTGERAGGMITIIATEAMSISGGGVFDGGISSTTGDQGAGAQITVTTPHLMMAGGAFLSTATFGEGQAGAITLQVGDLTLTEGSFIDSSSSGSGPGGTVMIQATGDVSISGRIEFFGTSFPSALSSLSLLDGSGGSITIEAQRVLVADGAEITSSASDPNSTGRGGNITVQATHMQLRNGATISAASIGLGDAGNLDLNIRGTLRSEGSAITTGADHAGGGNITLNAALIDMRDSRLTAEARGATGSNGGNVTVHTARMVMNRSLVLASAVEGNGGAITIDATRVFLADAITCSTGQCLSATSSAGGINGTVEISAPVTNVSGTVAPLRHTFATDSELLPEQCNTRQHTASSSRFILSGREGIPLTPTDLLPGFAGQDAMGAASAPPASWLSQRYALAPGAIVASPSRRCH